MSRFADPRATRTVELGACECPATPHSGDWCKVRSDLSGSELATLLKLDGMDEATAAATIAPFVLEWNLNDADGLAAIDADALFSLKGPTLHAIGEALGDVLRENLGLPNSPAAPSRASSRGSGSRTPKAQRTPTT